MHLHDVNEARPNPIFWTESRPSTIDGFSWFAILQYKEHIFEAPLPKAWTSWDDMGQTLALQPIFEKLRSQLAPILIAEDADGGLLEQGPSGPTINEAPKLELVPGIP